MFTYLLDIQSSSVCFDVDNIISMHLRKDSVISLALIFTTLVFHEERPIYNLTIVVFSRPAG